MSRSAVPGQESGLSRRAAAWLAAHASADPSRKASPDALRAALRPRGVEPTPPLLDFESRFGGLRIQGDEQTYSLGAGAMLSAGVPVRGGWVPVGSFSDGHFYMTPEGRLFAIDDVVDPVPLAADARRFVERLAIGQEYPRVAFGWPGRFAVEPSVPVAEAVAGALGAAKVEELSDDLQSVFATGTLGVWASPETIDMSCAPTVIIGETVDDVRRALRALAGLPGGASAAVGIGGGPTVEPTAAPAPPPLPPTPGLRFERWYDPSLQGSLAIGEDGTVEQRTRTKNGLLVERLHERGSTRRLHPAPSE